MTLLLILSVLIAWLTGFLFVCLFWPGQGAWHDRLSLKGFLAVGFGSGISSCHLFLWLTAFKSAGGGFIAAEIILSLALLAALLYQMRKRGAAKDGEGAPLPTTAPTHRPSRLIAAAFCLVLACAFAIFTVLISREPHGQYDAVAMWNTKARIIFRGGVRWTDAFSGYVQHPDYPLLLPLSIARGWTYLGKDPTVVPSVLAILFTFGTVGLLVSSVSALRGKTQGFLAGLVLFGPFTFISHGISQYADFPLAFFFLAALVLFSLQDRAPARGQGLLVLAGLAAGFSAWTKNEGILFLLTVVAARFAVVVPLKGLKVYGKQLLYFTYGLLPILVILFYFKSQVAVANDIIGAQGSHSLVGKLTDASRYQLILGALAGQFEKFGGWKPNPIYLLALYPLCVGVKVEGRDRPGVLTSVVALCLLLLGYCFIYLITPNDLNWHLSTSLDRLLLQLWPSFVFTYFSIVRTPDEASLELA